MATDYSDLYRERYVEEGWEEKLAKLCADSTLAYLCATRLAETLYNRCNELAPRRWGVTKTKDGIRVNFGDLECLYWWQCHDRLESCEALAP